MSTIDDPEVAERFYDPAATHRDALHAIEQGALARLETEAAAKGEAAEWLPVFAEHLMGNATRSADLAELIVGAKRSPASAEQRQRWADQSREVMRQEYGDRAGEVMVDTRALLAKNPKLAKYLDDTGLGNHERFVRVFSARAVELRKTGRLTGRSK